MLKEAIFPLHYQQLPHQIISSQQQTSCTLFIRHSLTHQSQELISEPQQPTFINSNITLSILNDHLIQKNTFTQQIISAIKCDFQIKFWLIRSPSLIPNSVGKLLGIAFEIPQFQSYQSRTISLFIIQDEQNQQKRTKQLQRFSSALQKKYIVQKQFHQKYKAIKRIGKGITACVYSSLCLVDKSQVAIKSFKKQVYFATDNGNGKKGFLKEFKILTMLNSRYLSSLLGVYESQHSIYIVQQLLQRTLYNYLQRFGFPQTSLCRRMLFQLLIGLRDLHSKNIMHRDLKLQNIMIRGAGKDNVEAVIVDFGLAEFVGEKEFVYIRCGTPGYVAPQIINLNRDDKVEIKYDRSCDVFSLGVIFHILLLGKTVFQGDDMKLVVQKNKLCSIDYQFKCFPSVSPFIKDLLKGMLIKQPSKRYTVQQLMNHKFFLQERILYNKEVEQLIQIEQSAKNKFKETQEIISEKKLSETQTFMKEQSAG